MSSWTQRPSKAENPLQCSVSVCVYYYMSGSWICTSYDIKFWTSYKVFWIFPEALAKNMKIWLQLGLEKQFQLFFAHHKSPFWFWKLSFMNSSFVNVIIWINALSEELYIMMDTHEVDSKNLGTIRCNFLSCTIFLHE